MANVQARGTEATRVAIDACRVTGIGFQESSLRDVVFRGCRIDLASFGFAKLMCVTFEDCLLAETSFLDCRLERVRFRGCDLNRGDFRGASLQACEFSRCGLSNLEGVGYLRGAAIDRPGIVANADVWAKALGIAVLDDDL